MAKMKTILHVDINSYFATLLQQENPYLRGKALGVVKDEGRTCLIAVSKEAKRYGIKTGCRLQEAQQLCPQILTVPAAFDRYLDATRRLKKVFTTIAPDVFIYSLDEAFVDVTLCRKYIYPDVQHLGQLVQQQIKQELGEWVTCNVGISHNRFLAKLASEIAPKGSVMHITEENKDAVLASVSFADVCGVGYRLEKKLAQLAIFNPYQIRMCDPAQLELLVGPFWKKELLKIAYGEETHLLGLVDTPPAHMKSVGRSITGYHLYDNELAIRKILYNLMEEVTYKVRRMDLAGRYIWIGLQGHDQFWGAHQTLSYYVRHTSEMFQVAYHQLYSQWQREFPVIKFMVGMSLLKPMSEIAQPLFGQFHQREKVYQAMDKISQKYGLFTLRSGSLLNQEIIRPEVTGFLGDRQYYGL